MDNPKGLMGIRKMDKALNALIRQLCGVMKGVNEKIDEDVFQWFDHVERMEDDRKVCW